MDSDVFAASRVVQGTVFPSRVGSVLRYASVGLWLRTQFMERL